ncbi:peptide deformylase [Candidatus Uhrbacteria bacterium]|nr:peptide deformylase [Candidatus Uhrbacteria bacterium]
MSRTQFGNPILRRRAKKVALKDVHTQTFETLIARMFFTIQDIGVGLAAPQIGKSIRLAVIDVHPLPHRPDVVPYKRVIVNPKIISYSKSVESDYEGCLSCGGIWGKVPRSKSVAVEYYDEHGEKHREVVRGFLAKVFQHEIDHLNGILYVDRMTDMHTLMTAEEFNKRIRKK